MSSVCRDLSRMSEDVSLFPEDDISETNHDFFKPSYEVSLSTPKQRQFSELNILTKVDKHLSR